MLNNDFKEFAVLFHSTQVEYLIVGGYALAAFGHPRYTGDLDFWIGTSPKNAACVLAALERFGFASFQSKTSKPTNAAPDGSKIWLMWRH